ncbi:ABC transporter permease [Actinoplanes sp. NPDC051470]|uniref:ABC transporter permease n=1 Tax=unclassified Actinoplanes TaxID=2626549 RepID=UPI003416782C
MSRTILAEWIKLRSLRSTWYTLAFLFVVSLGITMMSSSVAQEAYADAGDLWDPTAYSLTTYKVGQLILGVLAILVVTSEFATGLMRTTLAATPRRHRVLAAKVVIAATVAVVAGQVLMFAAFLIGQVMLAGQGVPNAGLGDPGVLSAVAAAGLYLTLVALLAVALGTIMRATAGALATLVGIVFLVPGLAPLFPSSMSGLFDFWPTLGAAAAIATVPDPDFPHPWWNMAGMSVGVAAVLVTAFVLLRRRDV